MDSIQILMNEHKNIKRMLKVVRQISINLYHHVEVPFEDLELIIDFVRTYADQHHHNKEEEILFEEMNRELGEPLKSGPILAMFSEHDLGRLYIQNIENAMEDVKAGEDNRIVDIIANAISYTDLLYRHIDKEDDTIYVFGKNNLSEETMKKVERETLKVEEAARKQGVQEKYIELLNRLEAKYLT